MKLFEFGFVLLLTLPQLTYADNRLAAPQALSLEVIGNLNLEKFDPNIDSQIDLQRFKDFLDGASKTSLIGKDKVRVDPKVPSKVVDINALVSSIDQPAVQMMVNVVRDKLGFVAKTLIEMDALAFQVEVGKSEYQNDKKGFKTVLHPAKKAFSKKLTDLIVSLLFVREPEMVAISACKTQTCVKVIHDAQRELILLGHKLNGRLESNAGIQSDLVKGVIGKILEQIRSKGTFEEKGMVQAGQELTEGELKNAPCVTSSSAEGIQIQQTFPKVSDLMVHAWEAIDEFSKGRIRTKFLAHLSRDSKVEWGFVKKADIPDGDDMPFVDKFLEISNARVINTETYIPNYYSSNGQNIPAMSETDKKGYRHFHTLVCTDRNNWAVFYGESFRANTHTPNLAVLDVGKKCVLESTGRFYRVRERHFGVGAMVTGPFQEFLIASYDEISPEGRWVGIEGFAGFGAGGRVASLIGKQKSALFLLNGGGGLGFFVGVNAISIRPMYKAQVKMWENSK